MTPDAASIREVVTAVADLRREVLGEIRRLSDSLEQRHDHLEQRVHAVELLVAAHVRDPGHPAGVERLGRLEDAVSGIRLYIARAAGAALVVGVAIQTAAQQLT